MTKLHQAVIDRKRSSMTTSVQKPVPVDLDVRDVDVYAAAMVLPLEKRKDFILTLEDRDQYRRLRKRFKKDIAEQAKLNILANLEEGKQSKLKRITEKELASRNRGLLQNIVAMNMLQRHWQLAFSSLIKALYWDIYNQQPPNGKYQHIWGPTYDVIDVPWIKEQFDQFLIFVAGK